MLQNSPQIQDIITPEDVSFWPPQPGWYILLFVCIIIVIIVIYKLILHRKRNAYRGFAIDALNMLEKQKPAITTLNDINAILKATALNTYKREAVSKLSGKSWTTFLVQSAKGINFTEIQEEYLSIGLYKKNVESINKDELKSLIDISKLWIKNHKSKTKQT